MGWPDPPRDEKGAPGDPPFLEMPNITVWEEGDPHPHCLRPPHPTASISARTGDVITCGGCRSGENLERGWKRREEPGESSGEGMGRVGGWRDIGGGITRQTDRGRKGGRGRSLTQQRQKES